MSSAPQRYLEVDETGDVSLVRFAVHKILPENVQGLQEQLFLLPDEGRHKLLLDFTGVGFIDYAVVGVLLTLSGKIATARGKLKLCCMDPNVFEVFVETKHDKNFEIYKDQRTALSKY
jgi:anti-sigma B factor antagonist